jgi:hypothetical protein
MLQALACIQHWALCYVVALQLARVLSLLQLLSRYT